MCVCGLHSKTSPTCTLIFSVPLLLSVHHDCYASIVLLGLFPWFAICVLHIQLEYSMRSHTPILGTSMSRCFNKLLSFPAIWSHEAILHTHSLSSHLFTKTMVSIEWALIPKKSHEVTLILFRKMFVPRNKQLACSDEPVQLVGKFDRSRNEKLGTLTTLDVRFLYS